MKRPAAAIRLVVNADDLGVSERVNAGIVLAHRRGIVTAASLMAVGRAFAQAVDWCRAFPALDLGVHLTLVAEIPLRPKSPLAYPDGRLPASAGLFLRRWAAGGFRREDLRAECSEQIERVLQQGLRVTHLDSHQHVHALPELAELCLDLAARYGIPFVRVPVEHPGMGFPLNRHDVKRIGGAIALCVSWGMARLVGARAPGLRSLRFLGFLDGGRLNRARIERLLDRLRPGRSYELMCHPGFAPQEPDLQRWGYHHEEELHALTDPSIRAAIAARGIRLCRFTDLI
jgi:chitin disaccharide deacetylase